MMRYDGPLHGGRFDFKGWEWGDLGSIFAPVMEALAERIAEVVGDQFRDDMKLDDAPRLETDMDGWRVGADDGLVISARLFGDGWLVIPLVDIVIDEDMTILNRDSGEADWDRTIANMQAALATLDRWKANIGGQIAEVRDIQRKERSTR